MKRTRTPFVLATLIAIVALACLSLIAPAHAAAAPADTHAVTATLPDAGVPVVDSQLPPQDQSQHHRSVAPLAGLVLTCGLMLGITLWASTACTGKGEWDNVSIWSNGVPSSTLSAILSTTGLAVLPFSTSAVAKNVTGNGTIGVCGRGGVNKLVIVTPSANTAVHFVSVDAIEQNNATSQKPV